MQVACHRLHIFLQACNVRESPVAELLQDIPPPGIRHGEIGLVDVSATVALAGLNRSLSLKMREDFFQIWFHFFSPFPLDSIPACVWCVKVYFGKNGLLEKYVAANQ